MASLACVHWYCIMASTRMSYRIARKYAKFQSSGLFWKRYLLCNYYCIAEVWMWMLIFYLLHDLYTFVVTSCTVFSLLLVLVNSPTYLDSCTGLFMSYDCKIRHLFVSYYGLLYCMWTSVVKSLLFLILSLEICVGFVEKSCYVDSNVI